MSAVSVFADAWRHRHKMGESNQTRELAAFLPAALEIQQAPPNPLAKWLGRSLILLFTLGVVWASYGEVNVVATAEGKIIPSSRVKQIQPIEKAVVKAILVSEGQHVEKGQPLIELDSVLTNADENSLRADLRNAILQLEVRKGLLALLDQAANKHQPTYKSIKLPSAADSDVYAQGYFKELLWQQWQAYRGKQKTLLNSLSENKAAQNGSRETIKKLEQTLPIITRRTEKHKQLYDRRMVAETEYLDLEQQRIEQAQDLAAERYQLKQLKASEAGIKSQLETLNAETKKTALNEITGLNRQISMLKEDLTKATDINAKQILYAPVSGQVQELSINTNGGVVTEAQQLMLIVPDEGKLEVEAFLENKDIGFVREGMDAEIKVQTFPFTKYGVINAKIISVSDDATVDEQHGLIYGMRLRMDKNTIWVKSREVKLMPGMAVTCEVKTASRKVIEYIWGPLLRYSGESLRER